MQLKDAGFLDIDVIDMDIVELGNLGYQLLFEEADVGKRKAEVVLSKLFGAEYNRSHKAFICRVQELPEDILLSYDILVGCLDNLEARFYVNSVVMRNEHVLSRNPPLIYIDGGSMGLGGQAQLVIPTVDLSPVPYL